MREFLGPFAAWLGLGMILVPAAVPACLSFPLAFDTPVTNPRAD